MKLDVKAFALACLLLWGIGLFGWTWWTIQFDGPSGEATFLGEIYRGSSITPSGGGIGLLRALADGLVGGAILA